MSANSVDPDQTPRSAASDLGLHCLPRSQKKEHQADMGWTLNIILAVDNVKLLLLKNKTRFIIIYHQSSVLEGTISKFLVPSELTMMHIAGSPEVHLEK